MIRNIQVICDGKLIGFVAQENLRTILRELVEKNPVFNVVSQTANCVCLETAN